MSYSQSPSICQTQARGRTDDPKSSVRDYRAEMRKSLERKTMAPLVANYHSDMASRERARTLAEADRMVQNSQHKYRGLSELNERMEQPAPKPRSKSRDQEEKESLMKEESRKFQQQVKSNMDRIVDTVEQVTPTVRRHSQDNSRNRNSSQGSKGSKKESYIQKLLGLNRTNSASSGHYPFSIPPW